MANITQFARQHSKKNIFITQFSEDLEDRLEMKDFYGGGGEAVVDTRRSLKKKSRHESGKVSSGGDDDREKRRLENEREKLGLLHPHRTDTTLQVPTSRPSQANLDPSSSSSMKRVESSISQFSERPEDEGGEVKETWDSKITFILATIGYAVGLGNIWRFPYLAQKNGGGAFLIPYWIMLFIEGLPIFFLELAIGQRLRKGSIGAWNRVSSYLGGIGIASGVVSFNVALYYNTIIAWCLFYFGSSFRSPLPWSSCPEQVVNETIAAPVQECEASSPTQYFWYRETLQISDDIDTPDNFNWKIAMCLLSAWGLVYMCIIKGITESPFVIWITALYPYVVLVIFFIRAIFLEGMADGILHLFKPKWSKLADPLVWLEAGTQIFFSLGLGFGGLIAYSSYNPTNNNCMRDAIIVAFTNCFTSMFAVIIIFAIMGFKAHTVHKKCLENVADIFDLAFNETGRQLPVPDDGILTWVNVAGETVTMTIPVCSLEEELDNSASGTGLAFILFTEAMNQFPFPNVWALIFFLMLFTLGIDSQFGTMQGVVQCVVDLKLFPNVRKEILTGVLCTICFVLSMSFAQGAGNYIFTLFDNFSGTIPLLVIALCEVLAVAYCYGLRRFSRDIQLMTGRKPSIYWLICWRYISPIAMVIILVASFVQMAVSGAGYEAWNSATGSTEMKEWPAWANALIGILIGIAIVWIPIVWMLKKCGFVFLVEEGPAWFPAEELRQFYELPPEYEVSKAERLLLGFNEDGSEGIFFKFTPDMDYAPTGNIILGGDDD